MHPLFIGLSHPTPPSHPPDKGTLGVDGMGAWAGRVFKLWMNPMHPSFRAGVARQTNNAFNHVDTKTGHKMAAPNSSIDFADRNAYVGRGTRRPNAVRLFWKG